MHLPHLQLGLIMRIFAEETASEGAKVPSEFVYESFENVVVSHGFQASKSTAMINKQDLTAFVEESLQDTGNFLVDVRVTPDNNVTVEIDNPEGVDIDTCASLTRKIEARFNRDEDDYELEVGSAGLTSPFKVRGQYVKNVGNPVEVLTKDGRKICGVLSQVDGDAENIEFTLLVPKKIKEPGKKKPVMVDEPVALKASECKSVKYSFDFK